MIPRDYITEWRSQAPWVQDFQVEQDLIISKALVDIFSDPLLRDSLAFRGGTALYKLFLKPPYQLDELLGTKLRAFYQRRQGRDLFDLAAALEDGRTDTARVIESFQACMDHAGSSVSRAQFEQNLAGKLADKSFAADIGPLLAQGHDSDIEDMAATVSNALIARLPGEPWQGGE